MWRYIYIYIYIYIYMYNKKGSAHAADPPKNREKMEIRFLTGFDRFGSFNLLLASVTHLDQFKTNKTDPKHDLKSKKSSFWSKFWPNSTDFWQILTILAANQMISYIIWYHIISYYIISYYIISYHIISYDMIRYHIIWYGMIWYDIVSYDISYHILWYDMLWYHIIWYHMTSSDMIWYHIIWFHMTWCHIIWYDKISYHTISYHIIWYQSSVLALIYGLFDRIF